MQVKTTDKIILKNYTKMRQFVLCQNFKITYELAKKVFL
jgi:hypothetical protein